MSLTGLLTAALRDTGLARARELARAGFPDADGLDLTAPPAMRPFAVAAVADQASGAGRPVLAVTATSREADDLAAALRSLLPEDQIAEFPAWETLPHERLSPRSDTVGRRLAVLRRLAHPEGNPVRVVVAPVRSLLQPQLKNLGDLEPVEPGHRRGGRPRRRRPSAVRHGVRPGRSGHQARRVRRPRRHPRRVPADRRAPAPGSSSGATRSRRSAPSRSPTSARSTRSTRCSRRRAASSC